MWYKRRFRAFNSSLQKYKIYKRRIKKEFDIKKFSLKNLFNTKIGQEFLFKFIEKTQIGTRNWLLQTADYESNNEEQKIFYMR